VSGPVYPIQQIILLAGCSTAEPVSSFDLHVKGKKYGRALKIY